MLHATANASGALDRDEFLGLKDDDLALNAQLRALVAASGLPSPVAMTIFNRQLGAAACSETAWRGFTAEPGTERYRPLTAEQLAHAVAQFARIGVHRE